MNRSFAAAFPGFWLSLWQYGVLVAAWFLLLEPARIFLNPRDINAAALGFFALGIIVGAVFGLVMIVDSALYASTLRVSWVKRIAMIVVTPIVGSVVLAIVYACGFTYGSDSMGTPALRSSWIAIYLATVGGLLLAHVYAIRAFHMRRR